MSAISCPIVLPKGDDMQSDITNLPGSIEPPNISIERSKAVRIRSDSR